MMIIASLLLAADLPPLSTAPFMDEPAAGRDFERQLNCLGGGAFDRLKDARPANEVAADLISSCRSVADDLRRSLTAVYKRKPNLLPAGTTPERAADQYVQTMNSRVEIVIQEGRSHK